MRISPKVISAKDSDSDSRYYYVTDNELVASLKAAFVLGGESAYDLKS